MTTLTANQTQVLVALATNTTIETQPWVTTTQIADISGLTKLVASGLVCSMIHKELLVSKKEKTGSQYQYTVKGLEAVAHLIQTEESVEEKPKAKRKSTKPSKEFSIKITANEEAVIKAIAHSEWCEVNGHPEVAESADDVSTWCYTDTFAEYAKLTVRTVKGTLGSLAKKGIIEVLDNFDEDNSVRFTEDGFKLMKEVIA